MLQFKFGRNILLVLLSITILFSVVYLCLFSIILANASNIVKLRMQYYEIVDKVRVAIGIPNSKVDNYSYIKSPIRVFGTNKSDGEYIYGFSGKLEDISLDKSQIVLSCCGKKRYNFKVNMAPSQEFLGSVNLVGIPTTTAIVIDPINFSLDKGRQFSLIWKDARNLVEILMTYDVEPSRPLNNISEPALIQVVEFKDN